METRMIDYMGLMNLIQNLIVLEYEQITDNVSDSIGIELELSDNTDLSCLFLECIVSFNDNEFREISISRRVNRIDNRTYDVHDFLYGNKCIAINYDDAIRELFFKTKNIPRVQKIINLIAKIVYKNDWNGIIDVDLIYNEIVHMYYPVDKCGNTYFLKNTNKA